MDINSVTKDYAQCISGGAITEPTGGTWVSAAAIYLGQTSPVNNSWLQALCLANGVTTPVYGSWVIALADNLGITQPLNGSWWYAIADSACSGPPPVPPVANFTSDVKLATGGTGGGPEQAESAIAYHQLPLRGCVIPKLSAKAITHEP